MDFGQTRPSGRPILRQFAPLSKNDYPQVHGILMVVHWFIFACFSLLILLAHIPARSIGDCPSTILQGFAGRRARELNPPILKELL
jgi:hypothetical protein